MHTLGRIVQSRLLKNCQVYVTKYKLKHNYLTFLIRHYASLMLFIS